MMGSLTQAYGAGVLYIAGGVVGVFILTWGIAAAYRAVGFNDSTSVKYRDEFFGARGSKEYYDSDDHSYFGETPDGRTYSRAAGSKRRSYDREY